MSTATADQIMATIRQDIDQMERSRMWPFSCYAVVKELSGGISGFFDVSPEELRMNYLINRSNPSVHSESVQILSQKVNEIRQRLRNDGNRDQIYQEYRNGGTANPSGGMDLSWLTTPGKRAQPNTTSAFGSTNQQSSFGSNPFSSTAPANPFGSTVQSPSPFQSQNSQSGFGSSSTFGSTPQTNTGFGSNPFGSTNQTRDVIRVSG